ncbi:hypothetical protein [Microbulbifer sp. PAAF003]|uniref:hypothetical protein n=1 Tax=Microbulbifer sp. PAAF003 TaxID=3243375 RepID=UPI00403A48D8
MKPEEKNCIEKRVRNRIIEVLELFSDEFRFDVAIANLEFWSDWFDANSIIQFDKAVFVREEIESLLAVNKFWERVQPDSKPSSQEWCDLLFESKHALNIFLKRGKFYE